jgi:hypothetical protein
MALRLGSAVICTNDKGLLTWLQTKNDKNSGLTGKRIPSNSTHILRLYHTMIKVTAFCVPKTLFS